MQTVLIREALKVGMTGLPPPRNSDSSLKSQYKAQVSTAKKQYKDQMKAVKKAYKNSDEYKLAVEKRRKTALKVGATVAATALASYGAYKLYRFTEGSIRDKNMRIAYENGHREVQKAINDMDKMFKNNMKDKNIDSYSYTINADAIVNKHLKKAQNDSLRTAYSNVRAYNKNYKKNGNGGLAKYSFSYTGPTEQSMRRR